MSSDTHFAGSIPALYERYMVPMLFEPYADDLVRRVAKRMGKRVLEIAAGTGVVTRRLAAAAPADVAIVATDLNEAMLKQAAAIDPGRPIQWRTADAMQLPFADREFDLIVCQFGAMFFPDKPRAFAEARRVLAPGGLFAFNVWDRIEVNEVADEVTNALASLMPDDPPRFMARTPHGYFDRERIRADVAAGGFDASEIETVSLRSVAGSAREAAIALCQGTPLRGEIEARGISVEQATEACERSLARRFGSGRVDARMQAHVVCAG